MPRKKENKDLRTVNFLLNPEDKLIIDEMVEYSVKKNAKGKVKVNVHHQVCRLQYCYYFICDYIQEESYVENMDKDTFVKVNQQYMKYLLGINDLSILLDNLISAGIIECDDKYKIGEYSYGYKLLRNNFRLYTFNMPEFSDKVKKIENKNKVKCELNGLKEYDQTARLITIDESELEETKVKIIENKYKDIEHRRQLMRILRLPNLRTLISQYHITLSSTTAINYNNNSATTNLTNINNNSINSNNSNPNDNSISTTNDYNNNNPNNNSTTTNYNNNSNNKNPFIDAQTVPVPENVISKALYDAQTVPGNSEKIKRCISAMKKAVSCLNKTRRHDAQTVPGKKKKEKLLDNATIYENYGVAVRNMKTSNIIWISDFRIKRFQDDLKITAEDDESTIARIDRVVSDINNGNFKTTRPFLEFKYKDEKGDEKSELVKSRVYSNHTNMFRELRQNMLLNGKSIIVADLSNSQPMIATLLFKLHYEESGEEIPADIKEYQRLCESGKFYEYFMEKCGIDTKSESDQAKGLRGQFKTAFFRLVFFSKSIEKSNYIKELFVAKYPSCYERVFNIKGRKNYSMSFKDFPKVLQYMEAKVFFDEINVPLLKAGIIAINNFDSICVNNMEDYEIAKQMILENFAANGITPNLKPEFFGTHKDKKKEKGEIKKQEMKKRFTVDGLLNSKPKETSAEPVQPPTKLQHLKLQSEEDIKMESAQKLWESLQDGDDFVEAPKLFTDQELYDYAVDCLTSNHNIVNPHNIEEMKKLINQEIEKNEREYQMSQRKKLVK